MCWVRVPCGNSTLAEDGQFQHTTFCNWLQSYAFAPNKSHTRSINATRCKTDFGGRAQFDRMLQYANRRTNAGRDGRPLRFTFYALPSTVHCPCSDGGPKSAVCLADE